MRKLTGVRRFLWLSCLGSIVVAAQAQETPSPQAPSFEVASVRPNSSADGLSLVWFGDPDKVREINVTVVSLIQFAYSLKDGELLGGPGWINSDKYDVNAKIPDAYVEKFRQHADRAGEEQRIGTLRLMMRSLLADRFALVVSKQTKELPVFVLAVAKDGPRLPPASGRFGMSSASEGLTMYGLGVDSLVAELSKRLSRRVVDETGMHEKYDVSLSWKSDAVESGSLDGAAGAQGTVTREPLEVRISRALEGQLGLKLESRRIPLPVIQVENIRRPSEN